MPSDDCAGCPLDMGFFGWNPKRRISALICPPSERDVRFGPAALSGDAQVSLANVRAGKKHCLFKGLNEYEKFILTP
jgi:hypothetical protein